MKQSVVYIGLGGNEGNAFVVLNQAIKKISMMEGIENIQTSRFYLTSPVGNIHQNTFINAICSFTTSTDPKKILLKMQEIEISLGKHPKPKDAPRPIDIDILFYGSLKYRDSELEIPHPNWMNRLFVLVPLSDLVHEIKVFNDKNILQVFVLKDLIDSLIQKSDQTVSLLEKKLL